MRKNLTPENAWLVCLAVALSFAVMGKPLRGAVVAKAADATTARVADNTISATKP